jgi:Nucleoside 2-deoxyribosyltransferase
MSKVYLAGPISGLPYAQAQVWRNVVADSLGPMIECYSPLRCKDYLRVHGALEGSYEGNPLSTDRGIMTRDHWDCMTCDLVFANLLGATERVSIGTAMEIAWAHAYRKPLVLVIEDAGNIHDHPMIREAVGFRVSTIAQGLETTRAILTSRVSTPRYQTPNSGDTR